MVKKSLIMIVKYAFLNYIISIKYYYINIIFIYTMCWLTVVNLLNIYELTYSYVMF